MGSQDYAFRDALRNSKYIVVIAGAGLSAASGIPTFRDGGGMWRSLDAASLATPEAFRENPSLVWQFYHYRRTKASQARPNAAHELLAKMSSPVHLRNVAPDAETFHLVTQNVDRLSVQSLVVLTAQMSRSRSGTSTTKKQMVFPSSILEMHDCLNPLCRALGAADASFADYQDAGSKEINIPVDELPHCPRCNALARPGVVWFGQKPYHLDEINSIIYQADLCLVIGTSSTVLPASTYAYRVQRHGGKVAVFNLDPSETDERADFVFKGPCEIVLPQLLPELRS